MGSSQGTFSSSDMILLGINDTLEQHKDLRKERQLLLTGLVHQPPSQGSTRPAPSTANESWRPEIQQPSDSSAYSTEASSVFDTPYHGPPCPSSLSEESDATSVQESDTASVQSFVETDGTPELMIPCEFVALGGCNQRFRLSEIRAWLNHVQGAHLRGHLPDETWCWFCDATFKTPLRRDAERETCFYQRISHIVGHLTNDTNVDHLRVRPDFPLLDHLAEHKLITQEAFDRAKNYSEVPEKFRRRQESPPPRPSLRGVELVTNRLGSRGQKDQRYHR